MKIEFLQLEKFFGKHQALGPLNLLIEDCKCLVILGPSGSGKSTLLRLIAGLQVPDQGTITINDHPIIFKEPELLVHRRSLGMVFQSWNLFSHLTSLENIMLPLHKVHNLSLEQAKERSIHLLKRFQMDKHAHKKPYALSGGQAQRIALIRAVAVEPRLLLLDEPTSALDPFMTAEVLDLIAELKKDGLDIILATHHINFAKLIADKVLFLADGKIVEYGTADKIFNHSNSELIKKYLALL